MASREPHRAKPGKLKNRQGKNKVFKDNSREGSRELCVKKLSVFPQPSDRITQHPEGNREGSPGRGGEATQPKTGGTLQGTPNPLGHIPHYPTGGSVNK